jgi:hypothetical protein
MNSLGLKPVSGAIPCRTLSSFPAACQPINFLSFLRSLGHQRREDERADTITAGGGQVWDRGKGSSAKRGDQEGLCEKDGMRSMDLLVDHLPLFTPARATLGENAMPRTWCPPPPPPACHLHQ